MSQPQKRIVTVSDGYAAWAKDYDAYQNPLIAVEEPVVRGLLGDVRGKRILDVACGTGRHFGWLGQQGAKVTGIDESQEMLTLARQKYPGGDLRCGSLSRLGALGQFEVVLCALMAEHVADVGDLLASLSSVLPVDGRLVLSVWHPFMILKGVLTHYEDEAAGVEYVLPSYAHLPSEYFRACQNSGLDIEALEEPRCDDAVIAAYPRMQKHCGLPLALILGARKRSSVSQSRATCSV